MFFFLLGFLASLAGALSGLGGGVIIKPVLDALTDLSASMIGFFSTVTVFVMALSSAIRHYFLKTKFESITIFLGLGAIVGGLLGTVLFQLTLTLLDSDSLVKITQNLILLLLLSAIVAYMNVTHKLRLKIRKKPVIFIIGAMLGIVSAYLGIGGGPINVVALCLFFSLDLKMATANSMILILFSQASKLLTLFLSESVPQNINMANLLYITVAAVLGALAGTGLNKRLDEKSLKLAYNAVMLFVMAACIWNIYHFFSK